MKQIRGFFSPLVFQSFLIHRLSQVKSPPICKTEDSYALITNNQLGVLLEEFKKKLMSASFIFMIGLAA